MKEEPLPEEEKTWEEKETEYSSIEAQARTALVGARLKEKLGLSSLPRSVRYENFDEISELHSILNAEFVESTYGTTGDLIEICDESDGFTKFITLKSKELAKPDLLQYHHELQSVIRDEQQECWMMFIGTGDITALHKYIHLGGEIDRAVRLAITNPPPQKNMKIRHEEWWDFLRVQEIMGAKGFETHQNLSFLQACKELAKERYPDDINIESRIKTIQNHVTKVEKRLGSALPRRNATS